LAILNLVSKTVGQGVSLNRIDHVGVVVDDLVEASALLSERFSLTPEETIERDDLHAAFFACGDTRVEIIEVLDPTARRDRLGDGESARIEHIAFEVDDLDSTLAVLDSLGVRPTAAPQDSGGRRTFWTVPVTTDGVMYQFIEFTGR
jgi:methylmalonyl-CoA/ethylmalonyl-CoA epimerase